MYLVILAGGSGARHKPLSGGATPATFERGADGRSALERTVARLGPLVGREDVVVVTDRRTGQLARVQAPDARILPEPMHRNTAASIALATVAVERPEGETMLVVTADHEVEDDDALRHAIEAVDADLQGADPNIQPPLLAFAVPPTAPDPGPTYLRPRLDGALRAGDLRLYPVDTYEPGPDLTRARDLYDSGTAYWTAGVFVWRRSAIRAAIERYTPLLTLIEPAYRSELALRAAYDRLQPLSIDEAVLAGAARDGALVMAPLEIGWRPVEVA
ncbi:MAG TPA: NTP transferase domain-containing protein [Candidatus Saccharimonadales bacterium]|nr:NTP transferase domain-containing protein [Candidatus Saccharimonadales bacterium]